MDSIRTGIHRTAVALKFISWAWMMLGSLAGLAMLYQVIFADMTLENAVFIYLLFCLVPAGVGLGLAWVVDGFSMKEGRPQT
jgi:hypothetical protein